MPASFAHSLLNDGSERFKLSILREPAHPGVVFKRDYIDGKGINLTQMAKSLGVRWATMSETFSGKRRVGLYMSAKFADYTGETILYWYQMQVDLDVWKFEQELLSNKTGA